MPPTPLDQKINQHFPGLAVRKDLVKAVKGNAIVPSYVLEYLLGQYCATDNEASIQSGIESVREILRRHYVHRNESELVRSHIRERGRYKVIDKISVTLNDKADTYEAAFANLGITKVIIDAETVKAHPKLLVSGVWCIADVEYIFVEERSVSPWILGSLKPIQLSHFDFESYLAARRQFNTEEWIDLLIQSIGFDPQWFSRRSKLLQLVRLIPFCERNYNLVELGPKGTGKSHIFSEFSPHGILISGGEVTVPKLFVNNSTGRVGLVGYWDVVAFDEFAGKQKRVDKALVDIMKNYMANKSFSRGVETLGGEASMAFVGNTKNTVPYMLKHSDLFEELPDKFYDSAYLDRLHFYIPGWEVDIIRGEMFSEGYGFVVDYLAEILRSLRNHDYAHRYQEQFHLSEEMSTRDRDSIQKTFSGLMKILFPHGEATPREIEELLTFAIEGRKRVKDQIYRLDDTFTPVEFGYRDGQGQFHPVQTLEEREYPHLYHRSSAPPTALDPIFAPELEPKHITIEDNQRGVSFEQLFLPYLQGAQSLNITDPYIHRFYQACNLMELLELLAQHKQEEDTLVVRLRTTLDDYPNSSQVEQLEKIKTACVTVGIDFRWIFEEEKTIHGRFIETDTGWKIVLDRGLDIFQPYESRNRFDFANRLQKFRACRSFYVTYVRQQK